MTGVTVDQMLEDDSRPLEIRRSGAMHEGDRRHQQGVALERGEGRTAPALQLVPHDRVAGDLDDARDNLAVARQQVIDVAGEPVREEHARVGGIGHFHAGVQRAPAQVVRAGNDIVRTECAANVGQRAPTPPASL